MQQSILEVKRKTETIFAARPRVADGMRRAVPARACAELIRYHLSEQISQSINGGNRLSLSTPAPRRHLHPDHFVYGVIVHRCAKDGVIQLNLGDLVVFYVVHTRYWHFPHLQELLRISPF